MIKRLLEINVSQKISPSQIVLYRWPSNHRDMTIRDSILTDYFGHSASVALSMTSDVPKGENTLRVVKR